MGYVRARTGLGCTEPDMGRNAGPGTLTMCGMARSGKQGFPWISGSSAMSFTECR